MAHVKKPEIIAVASGKGGTGKTLIIVCLGYALVRSGHRVLMVDADPGTDGLSLFMLGPQGTRQVDNFDPENTFRGVLRQFHDRGKLEFQPRLINRKRSDDHGISYNALISGKGIYGDLKTIGERLAVPDLDRDSFRKAISALFQTLREERDAEKKEERKYDYILVDTRGGFAFESTDVCALADSFLVVTEPDYTSFYQDRNLVRRISASAQQLDKKPLLRAIIVNKASEVEEISERLDLTKLERSFRLELTKEFPVTFEDTHPVPLDIEAMKAYKTHKIPYLSAPASYFSLATLSAFGEILKVVTARWQEDRIEQWNKLVDEVSTAIEQKNEQIESEVKERAHRAQELITLRSEVKEYKATIGGLEREYQGKIDELTRELKRTEARFERELRRADELLAATTKRVEKPQLLMLKPIALTMLIAISVVVVAAIVAGTYYWFSGRTEARLEALLIKVYAVGTPPSLRAEYVRELSQHGLRSFQGIDLSNVDLAGFDLKEASFRRAVLDFADLRETNLSSANLSETSLRGANLEGANLEGANLRLANLRQAYFYGARLTRADLQGTNLEGVGLTDDQLASAITDEYTILPNGKPGPFEHPRTRPTPQLQQKQTK